MVGLVHLLAALIVTIVFVPVAIWAYEQERAVTFAMTMFCGCASLWIVVAFGVVWVLAVL